MKRQHIKKTMSMIEHFKCILDVIIDEFNKLISDSMENEGKPMLNTKKKNSFLIRRVAVEHPEEKLPKDETIKEECNVKTRNEQNMNTATVDLNELSEVVNIDNTSDEDSADSQMQWKTVQKKKKKPTCVEKILSEEINDSKLNIDEKKRDEKQSN